MRKLETLLNELVPGHAADVSEIVDEIQEMTESSGFDWDWTTDHHILETGKRWKVTDATGKEFQNVRKLNSNTGFIEQTGPSDGPIYVRTLAPLPITVEQVDAEEGKSYVG